ncbi:MAG: phytoene/squalene synthase family protein [Chloroflexota bacterium]
MSLQIKQPWEYRLLNWAEEALHNGAQAPAIETNQDALEAAYAHCDTLTRVNSRTFYMASGLLPPHKRSAVRALYAFCRVTDDIVDEAENDNYRAESLARWRRLVAEPAPPETELVALAWADARARFQIPEGYARQLIDGVSRDLTVTRYATFSQLAEYAYGVASTVGLMAMHIIGFSGEEALPYAVRLGVALQITNILRDVADDWRAGRLYLPQDELEAFGLSEDHLHHGIIDDRWRNFMRFQIERNRNLYAESMEGIRLLERDGRFAIGAAATLYRDILTNIEAHNFDVFSRRAHLSTWGKLRRLPGIWLSSRRGSSA